MSASPSYEIGGIPNGHAIEEFDEQTGSGAELSQPDLNQRAMLDSHDEIGEITSHDNIAMGPSDVEPNELEDYNEHSAELTSETPDVVPNAHDTNIREAGFAVSAIPSLPVPILSIAQMMSQRATGLGSPEDIASTQDWSGHMASRGPPNSCKYGVAVPESPFDSAWSSQCCICIEDYQQGEKIVVIRNCNHIFHRECLQESIDKGMNHTCPYRCKGRIGWCWEGSWSAERRQPCEGGTIITMELTDSDPLSSMSVEEAAEAAGREG